MTGTTCLLTIHGIGFEQAPMPEQGVPGYADGLHERLSRYLGVVLADDPNRQRDHAGQAGAIYVQSHWPPESRDAEEGLSRLDGPLAEGQASIAHVALVYSHLEDVGPQLGATAETLAKVGVSAARYASVLGLLRMLYRDVQVVRQPDPQPPGGPAPSLRVRLPLLAPQAHSFLGLFGLGADAAADATTSDPLAVLRTLENDVASYVCSNELRERVRGFVRDSLVRLGTRDDVGAVVVNAHSQGTVVAFDVLQGLEPRLAAKVKVLVTAGSPLRKYVDLFQWGTDAGHVGEVGAWVNFWDARDPVADPLMPPQNWRVGDPIPSAAGSSLFEVCDPRGRRLPVAIADRQVDNVAHSRGTDLRAHNYWDNDAEVVAPLADLLRKAAG